MEAPEPDLTIHRTHPGALAGPVRLEVGSSGEVSRHGRGRQRRQSCCRVPDATTGPSGASSDGVCPGASMDTATWGARPANPVRA